MRLNKLAVVFAAAALSAVMVAGCSGGQKESAAESEAETSSNTTEAETTAEETTMAETTAAAEEMDGENYDTGDASRDNVRNQDDIGENELMAVSYTHLRAHET